jgi:hypothetical protein
MCHRSATCIEPGAPRVAALAYNAISITVDHLRAGKFGKPLDQCVGGRVLKQINDVVVITVDQNRP